MWVQNPSTVQLELELESRSLEIKPHLGNIFPSRLIKCASWAGASLTQQTKVPSVGKKSQRKRHSATQKKSVGIKTKKDIVLYIIMQFI